MHLRTRSSQPGFMVARSRLVSRDVILPGQVENLNVNRLVMLLNVCLYLKWGKDFQPATLITRRINRTSSFCPTLKVLPRGEALVRGHHRSLFDGDSSRHADETRLEICMIGKNQNNLSPTSTAGFITFVSISQVVLCWLFTCRSFRAFLVKNTRQLSSCCLAFSLYLHEDVCFKTSARSPESCCAPLQK